MTRLQFVERYRDTLLKGMSTARLSVEIDVGEMYKENMVKTNGEIAFEDRFTEGFYQGFLASRLQLG